MRKFALKIFGGLKDWTIKWADSPHMAIGLFFISLTEAIFFPIPPDVLMIAILSIKSNKWWFYAGVTTLGSVVGAVLAYVIGWEFYQTIGIHIVNKYGFQDAIISLGQQFSNHAFFVVITSAVTPIPFKIINIAAGVFSISIWVLIMAALIGRAVRYFVIAYVIKVLGKQFNEFVYKYFNILSLLFLFLLVLGFLILKFAF